MLRILIALMLLLCTLPVSGSMVERAVASQAEAEASPGAEEEVFLGTVLHVDPCVRVERVTYIESRVVGVEPTSELLRPPRT